MAKELAVGDKAPAFNLASDGSGKLGLEAFKGKAVVLYFYPKDDTSGCTKEALDFTAHGAALAKAGAVVLGASPDSVASHDKFKAKYKLDFPLVSDPEHAVAEKYGVWVEKSMYGRRYMGIERSTFLIDGAGRIARIWRKVKVTGHAEEVLGAVTALKA